MGHRSREDRPTADPQVRPYREAVVNYLRGAIPDHRVGYQGQLIPDALFREARRVGVAAQPVYPAEEIPMDRLAPREACRQLVELHDGGRLAELWTGREP